MLGAGAHHARRVRHATAEDLDHVEDLLTALRQFPELRERKRGHFSKRSQAFLHFHEDSGDLYVDVKIDGAFQRMRLRTPKERAEFLSQVQASLRL